MNQAEQAFWYLENLDVQGIFCSRKFGENEHLQLHCSFKKGEYIYMPQDHADKIFLITSGRVKIGSYSEDPKREITKAILTDGEVFGELALMGDGKRRDFAVAMEPTEVCIISTNEMNGLMKEHSTFGLYFMRLLGNRALLMESRLESMVFKDSSTRIKEFLVELVDKKGQRVGYEWVVRKFITHQEIANLTATSRQTVTTVLNELRNERVLTFDRRRLLVRDLDQLKKMI